ncbi:glycoside hydrolase family 38 C-terminal domain-containing protein [Salinibacterium sp. G-O1]|uniref:glycoside hydrolase family 38 N-terminal domain-containing protein n=1 Tax=Salinibacterium sp. G-O1 TaxID=3046208 RepID=UPI0024BA64DB|nr:alpha-mannosidase [Salinibacterium sp. G-O1]MDJ0335546.1 glycoside hydrolase family 38 C-terminal domain-containing protein [Salinibacterium sp. G-O1]
MVTADTDVDRTLANLREAARVAEGGWTPRDWSSRSSDGTESPARLGIENIHLRQVGVFSRFEVEAHHGVELTVRLDLPETVSGVPLSGEPLELTINSLRPIDIFVDDRRVFGDALPVVAAGPALITLVDEIIPGDNGQLTLRVLPSPVALGGEWGRTALTVQFTTPSLRARWRLYDLAVARLMLAHEFAATDDQRDSVRAAAQAIPLDAAHADSASLQSLLGDDSTLGKAFAGLTWLDESLAEYRVHCIGHSHIDLAWLWTYEDTREVIARDFESVLALFDDYPEFRFTHSQSRAYAELEHSRPDLFERAVRRIAEGRLEPATLQWVESDVHLPSGPAQARQLMEGVQYSRDRLGTSPSVLLAPDTFGQSGNLPQLAVQAGASVYYHHRANPGFPTGGAHWPAYWWIGDDGTRLLSVSTPIYLGPVTASRLAADLINLGRRNGIHDICYFYGVGDHGGGPTRADLDTIRLLNESTGFPSVGCSTMSEYATQLLASGAALPEHHGESDHVFEGCYVSQSGAKQMNRTSENLLTSAETLAALAGLAAGTELDAAWRTVLHHQFHDILGGSAVAGAYLDQSVDADATASVAARLSADSIAVLASGIAEDQIALTNALGSPRVEVVEIPAGLAGDATSATSGGAELPAQRTADGGLVVLAELGAFETLAVELGGEVSSLAPVRVDEVAGGFSVTTSTWRARVDGASGIVVSLVDVATGELLVGRGEVLSPESIRQHRHDLGLGALVVTHELPHEMSSWVTDRADSERTLMSGATTTVVEVGPVRAVLETGHSFGASRAIVRTTFTEGVPWIGFDVEVHWEEPGGAEFGVPGLSVSFGSRIPATELWTESPFAAARSRPDGYLRPMLRWADLGSADGGLAVANDSKYGVEALGPRMRVPLVRSAYDPDPTSEVGHVTTSSFRVMPHLAGWREVDVVGLGAGLNQPVHVSAGPGGTAADITLPRLEGDSGVVIAGMLQTAAGTLIRLAETTGRPCGATLSGLGRRRVWASDLLGERTDPVDSPDGEAFLQFGAFQVRTLLLETGA